MYVRIHYIHRYVMYVQHSLADKPFLFLLSKEKLVKFTVFKWLHPYEVLFEATKVTYLDRVAFFLFQHLQLLAISTKQNIGKWAKDRQRVKKEIEREAREMTRERERPQNKVKKKREKKREKKSDGERETEWWTD